ncbi:MAG: glycosyltransferase family 4 protein [Syntrophales bacterium]|nr:glycosyltransferase family 4 protein [Syntrophales bacterium]
MRVLMFGWEFPPYISGGLGTACFGLTQALSRLGVEIIFVLPHIRGRVEATHVEIRSAAEVIREAKDGITEFSPYLVASSFQNGRSFSGEYTARILEEVQAYGYAGEKIARREQFDLIHAHDWMTVFAGFYARRASGKPYIYHVHSLELDRSGEHVNKDIFEIESFGLKEADHIISVSYYTRSIIINRYGISPEKITVVHNAVSRREGREKFKVKKKSKEKIVLFLGRITFQKGPDYFVEAAARVIKVFPEVRFVMAGTGDMMPAIVERVASLGLGQYFHFTGFLQGEEVDRMYAMSDLYVMPSVSEPFGITPLEAMLYDVPVIISRQSGISEVVRHALKVDFWDVEGLANLMISALRYPALTEELTEQSRQELKNIHWDRSAEKVVNLYNRLCS